MAGRVPARPVHGRRRAQGSTNPLIDCHIIYALVLIAVAISYAGNTWGLGRWWTGLRFVRANEWAV